jgi:opacity protein-like surface antigen
MRSLLAAAAALVLSISSVSAQQASVISCYLEGTIGAGISKVTVSDAVTGDHLALASNGLLAAPGIGCDAHFGEMIVGGFGRYDFGKSSTSISAGGDTLGAHFDKMWLVAARAGMKVNPATTVYGFLGYSGMDLTFDANGGDVAGLKLNGLAVGGGIEWMIGGSWIAKADYTYTSLNTKTLAPDVNVDPVIHQVRVGVAYRFMP